MSKVELTETQKNIIQIRKRMNRRSIEEEKFNGFTKKKMWTYLWIFLFTPYGIYRLFDNYSAIYLLVYNIELLCFWQYFGLNSIIKRRYLSLHGFLFALPFLYMNALYTAVI